MLQGVPLMSFKHIKEKNQRWVVKLTLIQQRDRLKVDTPFSRRLWPGMIMDRSSVVVQRRWTEEGSYIRGGGRASVGTGLHCQFLPS